MREIQLVDELDNRGNYMVSVLDLMKDGERRNNFVDRTSQRRPVALKWRLPTTFHISLFSFLADVFLFKKNIRDGVGTPLYTTFTVFAVLYCLRCQYCSNCFILLKH